MSSDSASLGKCIEVEGVAEGPKVKAKRHLTETQLENLKRGREKLAEKRRLQREEKEKEDQLSNNEQMLGNDKDAVVEETQEPTEKDTVNNENIDEVSSQDEEDDYVPHGGCVMM
jgi:hypothetical protein